MSENRDYRNKFTLQEDELLLSLTKLNGPKRWKAIARKIPGKTARQCRDRYMNYLREGIGNHPWTEEEDYMLHQKVNEIGTHWSKIALYFKGRSTNNIKNRWYTFHLKKKFNFNDYIQNSQNISLNNYQNNLNNHIYQSQQINHNRFQYNQNILNYSQFISGQSIYSSPPPISIIINNDSISKNDYRINKNENQKYDLKMHINPDSNMIQESTSNNLLFLPNNNQNNIMNKGNNNINNNNADLKENKKDSSDINNLLNNKILGPLKNNGKIKRIPSIYELLNLNSES